jgi:hypothetical protein
MIIDTTLFNNEFDMLDIRIALTEHYVDKWIICEGNRTMSGRPKPFYLTDAVERYKHLGDRLHIVQLNIPESWSNWDIENGQRAALLEAYEDGNDTDIVMHSDLDEILNPTLWPEIVAKLDKENKPVTCSLDMYIYKFDQRVDRTWTGNVVARKNMFEDPAQLYKGIGARVGHTRKKKDRSHCVPFEKPAGWHWGWMGSDEIIKTKAQSCIETQHRDVDQMVESFHNLDAGSAINHKCATTKITPDYPAVVMNVIKHYPYWT